MSILSISTEQLRRMGDQEGLVLQGCGGDPKEWLDGINQILTDEGILKKGARFVDAYTFQHDGVTCLLFMAIPASATATGNVSGAIEGTWNAAKGQVQTIVNNVVFPVIDMILAVLLFVKIATAYMDYRKHGQFEFTAPAILFACLLFALTAPSYIWSILG